MLRSFLLALFATTAVVAHDDDFHFNDGMSMTDRVAGFLVFLVIGVAIFFACSTPCTWLDGPPRDRSDVIKVQIVERDVHRHPSDRV